MTTRRGALLLIALVLITAFVSYFTRLRPYDPVTAKRRLKQSRRLIEEISETIIPSTDTPGAKDAKVVDYIINVIEQCTDARNTGVILNGLEDLQRYSVENYSKPFEDCTLESRTAILSHFESKGKFSNYQLSRIRRKLWGQTFFEQIKWLTVSGYCVSQQGATQALVYEHVPIEYIPCIPYVKQQKAWATH